VSKLGPAPDACRAIAEIVQNPEECGWFQFPEEGVANSEIKGSTDFYAHPLPVRRFVLFGKAAGNGEVLGYHIEDKETYRYVMRLRGEYEPLPMFRFNLNNCTASQPSFSVWNTDQRQWKRHELPELEKEVTALVSYLNAFFYLMRSKGEVVTYRATPKSNNKKRVKRGQKPVFRWHTVALKSTIREKDEHKGGTHASPCLHERCGHWRHYKKSGKRVWIKPTMVGSIENGRVAHMYTFEDREND
jgi:hypothetical protein